MTRPGGLHAAVDTIAELYDEEVVARENARRLEAVGQDNQARDLFRKASRLRRLRLGMLRQWQLV